MTTPEALGAPDRPLLASLTPETRLLLAAAPLEPDPDRLAAPLAEELDWERLTAALLRERAVLPFWRRIRPHADRIEPSVRERLERMAAATELRLELLRRRLVESLDALEAAGVEPVILKGGALAHTLYPDPGERPMTDLDVLVAPERTGDALRALTDAGWERSEDQYPEARYRRHYHLPPLRDRRGSGATLEIHAGLLLPGHPFDLDPGALRRRAVTARVDGRAMRVPAPVDHLAYLCLHFAWGHALDTAAWRTFRDLEVLTGAPGFGWETFVERVREVRAEPFAWWTLRLAGSLVGQTSPPAVRDALRPALPRFALRRLERHLASELFLTEEGCPSVRVSRGLWLLATRPSGGRPPGIRPWSYEEDFLENAGADAAGEAGVGEADGGDAARDGEPTEVTGWAKLRRHLSEWRRWRAYVGRVLG